MKNVLITGVSGYIGNLLLERLAREPGVGRIVGVDINPTSFVSPKFTFIEHDVLRPFTNILNNNEIDTALHFAFVVAPIHDEAKARRVNVEGSRNFLDACAAAGVERVFYLGSNTAYGARRNNPALFTEDMPLDPNPDFPYCCDKAAVDLMFRDFAEKNPGVCVTIGRAAAVTGPRGDACGLTVLFLPVMVKAVGRDPLWQFIHEEDLAELVVRLLRERKAGIYNLAADGGLTYRQMIEKLGKPSISLPSWLLYPGIKISWKLRLQSRSQAGGLFMLMYPVILGNQKVKQATGYMPRYTGREAFDLFLKAVGRGKTRNYWS